MRRLRQLARIVYLVAGIVVVGGFAGSLFGPYTARFDALLGRPVPRLLVLACLVVLGVQMLGTLVRMATDRPEPDYVRPEGDACIEVTTDALASAARAAATECDVMVEQVGARVSGRDRAAVRITLDAIAFTDVDLKGLARRVQERVEDACTRMLGAPGVTVRVRFLPSKTVVVSKEVHGE